MDRTPLPIASRPREATAGPALRRPSRVPELAALTAIVAVGAYLRLAALDYAQFRLDDVNLWSIASHLAREPRILTHGIPASVAGFANGPFQAYLLLPGTLFTSDPLGAYVVVALFNIVSIVLFWAFVRGYWSARLGLLAALLYAVNPWAVVFSRRLWGNDLLAPFTVLLLWSLCALLRYGRGRDSLMPFLWLAIVIQVYVGALTHFALAGLGLVFGLRRLRLPYAAGGVVLFAVLTAPYLLGTLAPNFAELPFTLGSAAGPAQVDLVSISYMFHSVSAEGYQAFANNAGRIVDASGGWPQAVSWLTEAFLAIGLAIALAEAVRLLRRRAFAQALPSILALTAVLLPALLLVRHSAPVFVYYLLTGFPMHFLLVALGMRGAWRALRALVPRHASASRLLPSSAVGAAVVLIAGTHLFLSQAFFAAIGEYWPKSDYGVPLRYTLELAGQVRKLAHEEGFSRIYIAGPEKREGVLFRALRPELPSLSFLSLPDSFVVPESTAGKVLYVLPASEDGIGRAFAQHFGETVVASLDIPGSGLRYSLFALERRELESIGELPQISPGRREKARLGDFLELVGYDLPAEAAPGEHLRVTMYWRVLGRPPQEISLYVHLIGSLASLWGQRDGLGYPIEQWQAGDLLVLSHDVPVPVGAPPVDFQIEAGAYLRASGERVPIQREGKTDDRLRLGTVRVSRPVTPLALPAMTPVDLPFGEAIRLLGYELSTRTPAPGDRVRLTLYWQSWAPAAADYTVFSHLVGRDARPLAQADGPPAFGAYATSVWKAGDVVRDVHEIVIPPDLPPGRYWLLSGLYVPPGGPRLAPSDAPRSSFARLATWLERNTPYHTGARVDGDHVVLTAVDVTGRR